MTEQPRLTDVARAAIEAAGKPVVIDPPAPIIRDSTVAILETLQKQISTVLKDPTGNELQLANAVQIIIEIMLHDRPRTVR